MSRILLVEDDYALAMGTEYALQTEGYEVICAGTIKQAEQSLEDDIDLILLDVMLPDGSGLNFCRKIRQAGWHMPVLFLTTVSEEVNIVQGLEFGGDDYITKPYRVKELLSRIAANLRRYQRQNSSPEQDYHFGRHTFNFQKFRLLYDGNVVECPPSELRLLNELIQNEGIVLSRQVLLERLYDVDGMFIDDNTLSVYMKRLRTRLGEDASKIETVRGVGYRFSKGLNNEK